VAAKRAEKASGLASSDARPALSSYMRSALDYGSTTDVVTDALREAILDGVLPPSSWLREDELATELNVSRTPIREALRRLADQHLAVRLTNRGTIVAPLSLDDILAVYLVREQLEGLAARLAALRIPQGLLTSLLETHELMVAAAPQLDVAALAALNLKFHRLLREASANTYLDRFLVQVEHAVRRFGHSTYESPSRLQETLDEHRAIIDAIASGDPEAAAERATEHMRHARDARIRSILGSDYPAAGRVVPIGSM
jgi:DNA-binding GntR family transcriptional regulator